MAKFFYYIICYNDGLSVIANIKKSEKRGGS